MKGREQFKGTADREEAKDIKTQKGVIIRERRPNVERVEQVGGRGASRSGRGRESGTALRDFQIHQVHADVNVTWCFSASAVDHDS